MRTEILPLDPPALARAAALIRGKRVVAFPTETVYGLGARADDSTAVRRIFEAKGRPSTNPLIVHVLGVEQARELVLDFPPEAERLAAAFWPGPLTIVLPKRTGAIADEVTASGPTVALRVPAAPVARALLEASRLPIAAPSANRATTLSPTTAQHVLKSLDGRIPLVLDGGPCHHGIESTIVDLSRRPAVLLRPGAITLAALREHVDVVDPGAVFVSEGERAPSPGTSIRHYAPRATLILVPALRLSEELDRFRASPQLVGALAFGSPALISPPVEVLPAEPDGYASLLYAALHRLDDAGCDCVVVAEPPDDPAWAAVHDRLRRAASPA